MSALQSILAATDFSVQGDNAVRRAAWLAHRLEAGLHILHVVPAAAEQQAAQARARLRRLALELAAAHEVAITVEVAVGAPLQALRRAAARADLAVLGRRDPGALDGLRSARLTDRLLWSCPCPLLVVRRPAEAAYRQAVMPVDLGPAAEQTMRLGAAVAGEARLQLFHAADGYLAALLRRADAGEALIRDARAREQGQAMARMRRSAARLGLDRRRISFFVGRGPADLATLDLARARDADLIVAGRSGQSRLAAWLLGSVSRRLLCEAECDVLVVPQRHEDAPQPARDPAAAEAAWLHRQPSFPPRRVL